MRISDWSSDVCSSDLLGLIGFLQRTARLLDIVERLVRSKIGIDRPLDLGIGEGRVSLDEIFVDVDRAWRARCGHGIRYCGDRRIATARASRWEREWQYV